MFTSSNEFEMPSAIDMPLALGIALSQNLPAMQYFSSLPAAQQQQIVARTRNLNSKAEMRTFVASLEPKTELF